MHTIRNLEENSVKGTHQNVEVKRVKGKGRGIFAKRDFKRSEVVDISPYVKISNEEFDKYLADTVLSLYTFSDKGFMLLALGMSSMVNHSKKPNLITA